MVKTRIARIALMAFVALWALIGLIAPAAAQDIDKDAVEDLAGEVQDKDAQQVLEALKTSIEEDDLPDGFTEAVYVGSDATPEAGGQASGPSPNDLFADSDFQGAVGIVPFSITPEESDEEAEDDGEAAEGTIPAEMPNLDFYAIFFVVFEDEEAAKKALDQARDDGSLPEQGIEVEETDDFGAPGLIGSGGATQEGVSIALGLTGVQIGNVLVMGMAVQYDMSGEEVDAGESRDMAINLTETAINHLDKVVDDL